jgi:NAD(P)H-hydrate epimerase
MFSTDKAIEHISEVPNPELYQAVGVGPGIGYRLETAAMLRRLIVRCKCSMVLDADALNIIAGQMDLLNDLPPGSIITPHPGEFDRLFGQSVNSYERVAKAQQAAKQHNMIVVLKGAHTLVATPDSNLYFNCTGNPGMATAGSGDVLTGIITSLLAQGYSSVDAARLGVFLHGRAGDLALKSQSPQSLLAGDIAATLGDAYKSL